MKNISIIDLTHLSWTISRHSSGTAGSFLKSYEEIGGIKYYYKMSNFDTVKGVYGHESINEIVAGNIADLLGIPHLHYDLLHANVKVNDTVYETWLTRSADFKAGGEHKLTFETYYEVNRNENDDVWSFIVEKEVQEYFYQVFLLDYIICNRDRHGANIEVLEKNGEYRLAPVFDNGLSLMFSCYNNGMEMEKFDYLKDGPVNNYVGSVSLQDNLKKVPVEMIEQIKKIQWNEQRILKGLEVVMSDTCAVPKEYKECVMTMIRERVKQIEKIFN
ncbi:MAG: hypothetical protein IJP29_06745 [Lachnospiraceae bacterium]|nr:hypothetical protein [Lachnospiraceae bacterium]